MPELERQLGPEKWIYAYTADDERILQYRIGGGSWQTAIRDLDGKILREYRTELGGWTAFEDYVYRDGALLASVHPTEGTRWFGIDHLGSPRIRFNTAGAIAGVHTYYPFGEEATPGTGDTQQMKFTGHERDMLNTPTGFADDTDYMHARQFSPLTGRFHSFDPIGGSPRAPQSWNAYAYVIGNPMRYTDPTGMNVDDCAVLGECPAGHVEDEITVTGESPTATEISGINIFSIDKRFGPYNGVNLFNVPRVQQGFGGYGGSGLLLGELIPMAQRGNEWAQMILGYDTGEIGALGNPAFDPIELGATLGLGVLTSANKATITVIERKFLGQDGARSLMLIEKSGGQTISVTHRVFRGETLVHQHQTHIGRYGAQRMFPDVWVQFPNVPPRP